MLQGEPGIGKSTLCQKIAFDWSKALASTKVSDSSNEQPTVPKYLKRFQLLFYLHARDTGNSLADSVFDHILPEDFPLPKEDFQKYLEEHQKEILFIIDGFDEMNTECAAAVQKLVQRRILPHCTVLLTSRSQHAIHLLKHFDSLFNVNGYSVERMVEFVAKYSSDMTVPIETFGALLKKINSSSSMKDICRNPLNLCFLCILCEERNGELPHTGTEIYDEVVDMILQKASVRLSMPRGELDEHLKNLCEVAFSGLQQRVFAFPATLFFCEKVLASIGFLNKEVPISRLRNPIAYYVFTHKSFQEYLAARHISSLPGPERVALLKKHLRGRFMFTMWRFYCGINRNNETLLLDYFNEMYQQFCPLKVESVWGESSRLLVHMAGRMPFHRLSIQDIKAGPHIQCLKCINEIELERLSPGTMEAVIKCVPQQITLSHLLLSKSALGGLLNFLKVAKSHSQYHLIISAAAMFEDEQNEAILTLLKEIAKTGRVASLGLHMITSACQVKVAFDIFDLNKEHSPVKNLKLHCMNYVQDCTADICEICISGSMESIEIYDCTNPALLTKLLQITGSKCSLTKVIVRCCALDEDVLAALTSCIKAAENLAHFHMTNDQATRQKEVVMVLPLLAALQTRGPTLKTLALSELPSRQAWQADGTISSYTTEYLHNILSASDLNDLHLSKTVCDENLVRVLKAYVENSNLKFFELEHCFVICVKAFNELLSSLKTLPKLQHLSIFGSTFRSLTSDQQSESPPSETPGSRLLEVHSSPEATPHTPRSRSPHSPKPRRRFLSSRSVPPSFNFGRAISIPEDMYQRVIMSTANNQRSDERSSSIHIIHNLLETTQSLSHLVISDLHTDQVICLCKGLEANKTLVSVALPRCNFSEACTSALCSFLEKHPCLQELSMSRSNMNSIEMEPFFASVAKCKSLETLGLGSFFHDKHMAHLAEALTKNKTICNILLRDNNKITAQGAEVLHEMLRNNGRQVRILDMSDCRITRDNDIVEQLKDVALLVKVNWF